VHVPRNGSTGLKPDLGSLQWLPATFPRCHTMSPSTILHDRRRHAHLSGPPTSRARAAGAESCAFASAAGSTCQTGCAHAPRPPPPTPTVLSASARPQLLSEIFVVSKISAVRIKLLAAHVVQQALGMDAPLEKAAKLLGDAKLEPPDIKAVVSALHFILCSAARYDVPVDTLAFELQQLGLPREHTEALTHALREGRAALQQHFAACSLQLPRLSSLAWQVPPCPVRLPPIGRISCEQAGEPVAGARGREPRGCTHGRAQARRDRAKARRGAGTLAPCLWRVVQGRAWGRAYSGGAGAAGPPALRANPTHSEQEVNLRMSGETFALLHAELKTAKEATARLTGR
jgi:hypothetical protein